MSATQPLYQTIARRISTACGAKLSKPACKRLALLVCGIIAARSTVIAQVAAEINALQLTAACCSSNVERGLRRTLNDARLTPQNCYTPLLNAALDWPALLRGSKRVVLAVDESSKSDQTHLLRLSISYWGGSLPLAWLTWPQNVAQQPGHYWQQLDHLFAQVAQLLPPGLVVILTADRAYGVPNFIDRCTKQGWHYVVRLTTTGSHRYLDERGVEWEVSQLVKQRLKRRGQRFKARGQLFKEAQWRKVNLVGLWSNNAKESLVLISDLAASYELLALYERRFWIEPGFRNDKSRGWQWEKSQVQQEQHQAVLLVAMALASLVVVCAGIAAAQERTANEEQRRKGGCVSKPQRAKESIFTLGLGKLRQWLYQRAGELVWRLPELDGISWLRRWHACQARWFVLPPARQAA
jgi:hypothetical protein